MYGEHLRLINEQKKKDNIICLCTVLKILWEQTKGNGSITTLQPTLESYPIAHKHQLLSVLKNKGILKQINIQRYTSETRNQHLYQWISTTEPNIHMATAIYDECSIIHNAYKHRQLWPLDLKSCGLFH